MKSKLRKSFIHHELYIPLEGYAHNMPAKPDCDSGLQEAGIAASWLRSGTCFKKKNFNSYSYISRTALALQYSHTALWNKTRLPWQRSTNHSIRPTENLFSFPNQPYNPFTSLQLGGLPPTTTTTTTTGDGSFPCSLPARVSRF